MSTRARALIALVIVLMAVLFSAVLFSRLFYGRSLAATAIETYYRVRNTKRKYTDEAYADELLEQKRNAQDRAVTPPDDLKNHWEEREILGSQVFILNPDQEGALSVIYVHGGSYVKNINSRQWLFADRLASRAGVSVLLPAYPLAPRHTWEETYDLLTEVYRQARERSDKVILMGDSAGGGIAAGFCEYLSAAGEKAPDQLILFSPCLDGTFSNPLCPEYEQKDAMLGIYGLKQLCAVWAGETGSADYRVSPLLGDVSGLQNVTVFVGDRELFYPDAVLFQEKLTKAGVNSRLIVQKGMLHDYVLLPIPEAERALRQVCEILEQ